MVRLLFAGFTALVTVSPAAYAADPQIIITAGSTPNITRARIIDAAKKVCQSAVIHDPSGDFGSLEQCIDNTALSAQRVPDDRQRKTLAQRGN